MPDAARPNILLVFPDQHRHDWTGFNPALPGLTPNLERLAERGVRFTRAFCPSPLCAPSRACLASGRSYPRGRVPNNSYNYPLDLPTFYSRLRGAGYAVSGVGKFDLAKGLHDWNIDGRRLLHDWGFTSGRDCEGKLDAVGSFKQTGGKPRGPYMAYLASRGLAETHVADFAVRDHHVGCFPTALPEDAYCDNWIGAQALEEIERFEKDSPWFLQVNFTGPHNPPDVTVSMRERWKNASLPMPIVPGSLDLNAAQETRRNYSAMVENIDRMLGEFIEAIESRGELERTIVVYSSDHGEMLGDHGRWGKSIWRDSSIRIPLVMAGPGIVANGEASESLICLEDLAPTFLEWADAEPLPDIDGKSLASTLAGTDSLEPGRAILCGLDEGSSWRSISTETGTDRGRAKLVADRAIRGQNPSSPAISLFYPDLDPTETDNRAAAEPATVSALLAILAERDPVWSADNQSGSCA